jgi:hypothetical protein
MVPRRIALTCMLAALTAFAVGGCNDKYAPYSFKDFPGYTPSGPKAPADPRRTPAGFVP